MIYKDSAEWIAAYEQLKRVLAQREHIPKSIKLAAKQKRSNP
jgi:hypothetical protein